MSEEKNKRTPEEVELDIQIKKEKVKAIKAETKSNEASARKTLAEAKQEEVELQRMELELLEAQEKRKKKKSHDEENFLYRFNSDVNCTSVKACMSKITEWHRLEPGSNIEVIFASPGGSIIDGFELFDFLQHLRNEGHHVTTGTLGYAASMAGVLLQAGDTRWIGHQAWMMIHRAAFGAYGKTFEIEDEVKFVRRIEERILDIFTSRSNLTRNKIKRNWDRKDWWISADEALELSLVDEVRAVMPEHMVNKKKRGK